MQGPVAVPGDPVWRFVVRIREDGGAILTSWPHQAKWFDTRQGADGFMKRHQLTGRRIVRRPVDGIEVVS